MGLLALSMMFACSSQEDKLVNKCCECLKAEEEGKRFRDCMGSEMYEELGTYDHSPKEKDFTIRVRETCPDVAGDFRL